MARSFVLASSQYLQVASAVLSGTPLAMACWFNGDASAAPYTLMSIADTATDTNYFRLVHAGDTGGNPVTAISRGGGGEATAATSTGYNSLNVWAHACAIFGSSTDRRAYLNGAGKGTNATSVTPSGLDATAIGRLVRATPLQYQSGLIAEAAVWDLTPWGGTDTARADNFETKVLPALALGYSPALFLQGLAAYWPLIGRYSPEIDLAGGFGLTVTGATVAVHPRMIYPKRRAVFSVSGGAPPATTILPQMMQQGLFVSSLGAA